MKVYELYGIGDLRYEETAKPELKNGEALVKVQAAGICGSDIPRIYRTGTYHFPTIPGHEFAGTVVSVADEAAEDLVGKRVGIFPLIPCKNCSPCKVHQYELCRQYNYMGSRCDGGFAEYIAVPLWNILPLPEEVPFEIAAMMEPSAVAYHAVGRLQQKDAKWRHEAKVAVLGLGTIGLLILQWLNIRGYRNVICTGHHAEAEKILQRNDWNKADYAVTNDIRETVSFIQKHTDDQGVDIVIDCIGSSSSLTDALNAAAPGGQVLIVANPQGDLQLDKMSYWQILRKQIHMIGTWNSSFDPEAESDDWREVLSACREGKLHPEWLISHRFSFDELPKGLDVMRDKEQYHVKVMIGESK